ncbi:MAG: aminotransferase class V-fold PLP-dependent enzyme [Vibrionaceae bacterium]
MPNSPQLFDLCQLRSQFPALSGEPNGETVIYLDSAATTQKPQVVIDCVTQFYKNSQANVHRAAHQLGRAATDSYEAAREVVANFLGAPAQGIVFTKGATESINLVAQSFARVFLQENDEIIVSELEHHANLLPWQQVAAQTKARLVKWPVDARNGTLDLSVLQRLVSSRTKLIAVAHMSNVTGARNQIGEIVAMARQVGAKVLVDGAQAVAHEAVDVQALDVDFYVFSGHKLFAPAGIGVLYAKPELLERMPPWQLGGKMVTQVSFASSTFAPAPARFEPGTPNVAGALALAQAILWYTPWLPFAHEHTALLQQRLVAGLQKITGMTLIGLQVGAPIVSFNVQDLHHSDIAMLLDEQNIAVRAGKHCAHPLMQALGIDGCVRISLALYNSASEIDACIDAVNKACQLLKE